MNPVPVPPEDTGKAEVKKPIYNAPRQSTATQIRLKVIQGSVERLMAEVEELGEIKQFLVNLRRQMDEETAVIQNMTNLAFTALSEEIEFDTCKKLTEK